MRKIDRVYIKLYCVNRKQRHVPYLLHAVLLTVKMALNTDEVLDRVLNGSDVSDLDSSIESDLDLNGVDLDLLMEELNVVFLYFT